MNIRVINRYIGIIFLFSFQITIFSQIDYENPPWETGCDTSGTGTQTEMNTCSFERYEIADSILNNKYELIVKYLESELVRASSYPNSGSDSFMEGVKLLRSQKNRVKQSKLDFVAFRSSTIGIIAHQYDGGSMMPLAMNTYALDLTINQIKILEKLQDEIIH